MGPQILKTPPNSNVISPYTIFAFRNAGSPDLHIVERQTLYVFGPPTHGECHCFGPIRFHQPHNENEGKMC